MVLFRFRRCAFFALLAEQTILEIFDLGILENDLLFKRFYLFLSLGMLGFPIVRLLAQFDLFLFGNRNPLL